MQINFAGRSHESSSPSRGNAHPVFTLRVEQYDDDAMVIDPPMDQFVSTQPRPQLSAHDRAVKRSREQRKFDVQINSRQTLLEKAVMAKKLIEQRNKHEISGPDLVQAMADLRALKIRY